MTLKTAFPTIIALLACTHLASPAQADDKELRTVAVSGTAKTKIAPDMVIWNVSVNATHKKLAKAKKQSDTQVQAVLKAARQFKIKDKDMQTGHLNIRKVYEHRKYGDRGSFKHYAIVRSVTLIQRNVKQFDQLFTQLIQNNDIEVNYSLALSNLEEVRANTRLKAVKAAQNKADAMAKELGEKLGWVLKVQEHAEPQHVYARNANNVVFQSMDDNSSGGGSTFAAGVIEVQISINATFAMR